MPLTFLQNIPWKLIGIIIICTGIYFLGRSHGADSVQKDWDAANGKQSKIVIDTIIKQVAGSERIITKYVDKVRIIREKGQTITKEVPIYVPYDSCTLPGGFRVLHDAAASNEFPDASRITDAASVNAQVAAGTVVENYATCYQIREQLISLQDWVKEMRNSK